MPGNDAVHANPTANGLSADIKLTSHGSDWYWAVTAVMTCATLAFLGLALTKPRQNRLFYYITGSVTLVASIAYFSMASHLGWTPVDVEFLRNGGGVGGITREIYYVRYIDWVITTPLLLTDLLLTAGIPLPQTLFIILIDEVMIITGLVGALVKSSYKWGYFVFGCAALLYIVYVLVWDARKHANALGPDVGRVFLYTGTLTAFLWTLYPIAWGISEGANLITPHSEAVFYGILDLLAKPVFGALLIWGHRNIDPAQLGLHLVDYTGADAIHDAREKKHANGSNGHSNGNGLTTDATNNGVHHPETTV